MLYFSKFSRECMPRFHYNYRHSKRAAITSFFYTKFYQNIIIHQNAGMSQNFLGKLNILYSKRADKIISFYIKMIIFGIILRNI